MSCGKDCKTLIWNPNSGELMGELAQDTNWTFQTEWCPRNPDLLASASFDGKISVYSLQNSSESDDTKTVVDTTNDDPFSAALNAAAPPASSAFALKQPPKWLRCPVGASFGFGGKLVTFNNKAGQAAIQAAASLPPGQAPAPQTVPRAVTIHSIVTNQETVKRSVELETALESQTIEQLVDERVQQSEQNNDKDEKESWEIIKTLLAPDARGQLMDYLGFQKSEVIAAVAKATAGKNGLNPAVSESTEVTETAVSETTASPESTGAAETTTEEPIVEGQESQEAVTQETSDLEVVAPVEEVATEEEKPKSVSGLFGEGGDDFFNQASNNQVATEESAAALGSVLSREPLQLYAQGTSETDRLITRAIVLGDFDSAVDLCLANDKLSDALLFAICGGGDLLNRTQQAYFKRQSKATSYLRLLESIIDNDLNTVVANATLDEWTSVIVVLCTFAKPEEFRPLCEALGERLEEGWSKGDSESAKEFRRHATLCYLVAGNLEKVSRIWIAEQEEEIQNSEKEDAYASSLQHLIEKVTIFRKVINFEDAAFFETTEQKMSYEYPLSPLYDKYCEYAELLAAQGKLTTALTYLSLTPVVYRKATFDKLAVIRDRVYRACPASIAGQFVDPAVPFEKKAIVSKAETQAAAAAPAPAAQATTGYNAQPQTQQYQNNYQTYQSTTTATTTQSYAPDRSTTSSYAPITNAYTPTAPITNAYTPSAPTSYAPTASSSYAPTTSSYAPPTNSYAPTNTSSYVPSNTSSYTPAGSSNYSPSAPVATNSYAPTTATGNPTNAYQPQASAAAPVQSSYGYNQPTNNYNQGGYNSNFSGGYSGNDQYSGYNAGATVPAPPPVTGVPPPPRSSAPPKKAEGAWNDPPMSAAKKMKSPIIASTKRVTSPFPNQPAATSFVQNSHQQQQPNFPPPPQSGPPMNRGPPQGPPMNRGPPPPPQAGMMQQRHSGPPPPMGGHPPMGQQAHMAPPPSMGMVPPPRNNPLPPPPMNATPPPPLSKRGPPQGPPPQGPPQGQVYSQRMN